MQNFTLMETTIFEIAGGMADLPPLIKGMGLVKEGLK